MSKFYSKPLRAEILSTTSMKLQVGGSFIVVFELNSLGVPQKMILSRDGKAACYMSGAILEVHASVFDPHILEIATKGPTFHQVQVEGDLARLGFTPKAVAPMADYLSKGRW